MEGKQKIIDDILASANANAQRIVEQATAEVDAMLDELGASLAAAREQSAKKYRADAQAAYDGQVKLGELEAGKVMLEARQACVSAVYDGVRERILSASDKEYLALLQKLIVDACENGDEVIAAKADEKRVTAAWIKRVGESAKRKLTLAKTRGEFAGGVILRNAKYDRDLTVDEIVAELKERTVGETVVKLGL